MVDNVVIGAKNRNFLRQCCVSLKTIVLSQHVIAVINIFQKGPLLCEF